MEFGTAGIRGPVTELTPDLALRVGRAVGVDAREAGTELVVARDGRTTGGALAAAVEAGARSAGADVRRAGQLPTPALAFASRGRHGVMLTASHNPPGDNGIKCFQDGREYDREAEQRIERRLSEGLDPVAWDAYGHSERIDPLEAYREAVLAYARGYGDEPEFRVTVDCGTGMAALATPSVLESLGAEVRALHAHVDGQFGARESKPTAESLTDLRTVVADGPATLGIGHDGDADRIVLVDSEGEPIDESTVLAVLAEAFVRASDAEDPVVVTTPNASSRIDERVRAAGGHTTRVALGTLHEGVAAAEGTVVFAGEPWKHIHPGLGGWMDAVASAAVFTRLVATDGLAALREPVTERPFRRTSIACPDGDKPAAMDTVATALPDAFPEAALETEYGVRLELPDGSWVLVRPSGTEPYIRIYAESDTVEDLLGTVEAHVERAIEAA